ncbi:MAG: endonuclease III domain-containing protein [Dehalococcoidia bacterium]
MPADVSAILARLRTVYGEIRWRPHHDGISELILTILSQHTSDRLSGQAFAQLLSRFPDWDSIRLAPISQIEDAIQTAGLWKMKAPRIKQVLERVLAERGGYDLDSLQAMPLEEAKQWLLSLPGVGPKTAACVLMFAYGRPALPVDTHVYRVAMRLGLIPPKMSADRAHAHLEAMIPPREIYPFHIGLIKHGRYVCIAQRPRCDACILSDICPSAFSFGARQPGTAPRRRV